ncbi:conserved oligomeric Golgi complex subunit 4-like [Eriocheir sinensis]|uniref:conserved oligomeric Golgi complex subunit 4-like n=1 Tax=Eriocheir sinensis TaxID=95602 RepID=UPI0021C80F85|nr:conserved oligomeric Golgi complex subunit 4-like [Eriocheir sinensis]
MVDEEEHVDPRKLTCLADIQKAHDKLCREEVAVAERLEWSVGNRHHLEARLSQLARLVPTLQLVRADARQLENTISFTHQLANNVSAKVRQLDLAKSRVVETQARVGDLLDLEGCSGGVATALTQEDYETAAAHIHRFLAMDETLLLHTTDSASKAENVESWFERLRQAEKELSGLITHKFDEAVKREDMASVDRFFKLFPLLNKHQEGLRKFTTYLCAKVQESTAQNLASAQNLGPREKRSHVVWADTFTLLFEGIARTIEVRQPIIETYYGEHFPVSLHIQILVHQNFYIYALYPLPGLLLYDVSSISHIPYHFPVTSLSHPYHTVTNTFPCIIPCLYPLSPHTLHILVTLPPHSPSITRLGVGRELRIDQPDPRDLDTLLGELTLINARAELYLRFIRRRVAADFEASLPEKDVREKKESEFEAKLSQSQLVCDMAIFVGDYTVLEQFYLNESFKKALAMDTVEDGAQTSSIVDDAFYIIKKSIRRSIASSSVDGVCAMLNHAVTLVETQLAEGFRQTLRKGFPAQGYLDLNQAYTVLQSSLQSTLQAGKINSSSTDSDALRQAFLTALNNTETSIRHIRSLHGSLEESVNTAMPGLSMTARAKLDSCLNDLKATTGKLALVGEFGISQLRATAVKPRVKPWVDTFNTTSHDIKEEEFASYEANDPFSQSLMVQVDGLLGSFAPLLTEDNYKALVGVLVGEVAEQLEKAVFKSSFNRLGGLQFDREVRAIVGYLSQVSEWGVREQLTRLTQMATLLNLESLAEVSEYSTTTTWRLTPSEMRKVLQLRVDFKAEEIKRLKL